MVGEIRSDERENSSIYAQWFLIELKVALEANPYAGVSFDMMKDKVPTNVQNGTVLFRLNDNWRSPEYNDIPVPFVISYGSSGEQIFVELATSFYQTKLPIHPTVDDIEQINKILGLALMIDTFMIQEGLSRMNHAHAQFPNDAAQISPQQS